MASPAQAQVTSPEFLTQEKIEENIEKRKVFFKLFAHTGSEKFERCFVGRQIGELPGHHLLYPATNNPQDLSAILKLTRTADNKAFVISNLILVNTFLEVRDGHPATFTEPSTNKEADFKPGQRLSLMAKDPTSTKFALFATIGSTNIYLKPESGLITAAKDDNADEYYNFSLSTFAPLPEIGPQIGPLDLNGVSTYTQPGVVGVFFIRVPLPDNNIVAIDIVTKEVIFMEQFSSPNTSVWMNITPTGSGNTYLWSNYGAPEEYVTIENRPVSGTSRWQAVSIEANPTPFQIVSPGPNSTDLGFLSTTAGRRSYLEPVNHDGQKIIVGTSRVVHPFNLFFVPHVINRIPIAEAT